MKRLAAQLSHVKVDCCGKCEDKDFERETCENVFTDML